MGTVKPAATAGQGLPEPIAYQGQHMIDLPVGDDAWLRFKGISYWLSPTADPTLGGLCWVYLLTEPGLELTCEVCDEAGRRLDLGHGPQGDPTPLSIALKQLVNGTDIWQDLVQGTSLTFRLNYRGSVGVKDVVVPVDFGEPVAQALAGRRVYFQVSEQPLAFTSLAVQDRQRSRDETPLIYLHGYQDPDSGLETIGTGCRRSR